MAWHSIARQSSVHSRRQKSMMRGNRLLGNAIMPTRKVAKLFRPDALPKTNLKPTPMSKTKPRSLREKAKSVAIKHGLAMVSARAKRDGYQLLKQDWRGYP